MVPIVLTHCLDLLSSNSFDNADIFELCSDCRHRRIEVVVSSQICLLNQCKLWKSWWGWWWNEFNTVGSRTGAVRYLIGTMESYKQLVRSVSNWLCSKLVLINIRISFEFKTQRRRSNEQVQVARQLQRGETNWLNAHGLLLSKSRYAQIHVSWLQVHGLIGLFIQLGHEFSFLCTSGVERLITYQRSPICSSLKLWHWFWLLISFEDWRRFVGRDYFQPTNSVLWF